MFAKSLVPVDLAETDMTQHLIKTAQALAQAFDSVLRIINLCSVVPVAFFDYEAGDFAPEIKRGLEAELDKLASQINAPAARVSTKLLFGPVYQQILAEADAWSAELIVVGSHMPDLERSLIGSEADAIVSQSRCSVLVLRN